MKRHHIFPSFAIFAVAIMMVFGLTVFMSGQPADPNPAPVQRSHHHAGAVEDWSFHHLIFSNPGTYDQVKNDPAAYSRWLRIRYDTRYILQQMKRNHTSDGGYPPQADVNTLGNALNSPMAFGFGKPKPQPKAKSTPNPLTGLWTMNMGSGAMVGADTYPAKYSFDTTNAYCDNATSPNQPDYVVYPTSLAGSVAATATGEIDFSGTPTSSSSTTSNYRIQIGSISYYYTTDTGIVSAPSAGVCYLSTGGNQTTAENNLWGAIAFPTYGTSSDWQCKSATNSAVTSVTEVSGATTITMSAAVAGAAGDFTLSVGGSVTNVSVPSDNDGQNGGSAQPSIIAYDNLYSSCPTTSVPWPNVYWQYATGGTVQTSPVLSLDGTKVAFMQSNSSNHASLVVLQWYKSSTLVTPTTVTSFSDSSCSSGPCMVVVPFADNDNDTNSSPFYDYGNDVLYVGDNSGALHKFSGVFNGVPSEITSNWPTPISTGYALSSPVLDTTNQIVYVGSSDGEVSWIASGGGTVTTSGQLALSGSGEVGIADAPLVNPAASTVYVFVGNDGGGSGNNTCNATSICHPGVYQLATSFSSGSTGSEVTLGTTYTAYPYGSNTFPVYDGTPDNAFFNSGTAGNLYVCAEDPFTAVPILYGVPVTSGGLGTVTTVGALATGEAGCSPITEFLNGSTDYIFLSVTGNAATTSPVGCPNNSSGCLMSFTVTNPLAAGAPTTAAASETSGTSAVVVDNSLGTNGDSQIYFTPLGNSTCSGNGSTGSGTGGCATQASQANLN